MNQTIKPNESDWTGKAGRANTRKEAEPPGAVPLTGLLTSGGRSLRRVSSLLWTLALLCFVLAAFVWWELLHI